MAESKIIHIRVDNDLHKRLLEKSSLGGRTLSGYVVWIIKKFMGILK